MTSMDPNFGGTLLNYFETTAEKTFKILVKVKLDFFLYHFASF